MTSWIHILPRMLKMSKMLSNGGMNIAQTTPISHTWPLIILQSQVRLCFWQLFYYLIVNLLYSYLYWCRTPVQQRSHPLTSPVQPFVVSIYQCTSLSGQLEPSWVCERQRHQECSYPGRRSRSWGWYSRWLGHQLALAYLVLHMYSTLANGFC